MYYRHTNARIIKDSVSKEGARLTTMQLEYPLFIHAEFMTHRVFSRNAASARAIPVNKILAQVWKNPVTPAVWLQNKPGMQGVEQMSGFKRNLAKFTWLTASKIACVAAWTMMKAGLHKQWANRVLAPFQRITVVVSSTEWDNFFELRCHKDAQPEIASLAHKMRDQLRISEPKVLNYNEWHLPFVTGKDEDLSTIDKIKKSVACCARVSYKNHDKTDTTVEQNNKLYERLVISEPMHASPIEHQAHPDFKDENGNWACPELHGNFVGWVQYRKLVEKRIPIN